MDGKDLLPIEIAAALERGATVVTGNQRAARTLRREFDRRQRRLGLESWRPPAVLAWDTWTAGLWRQLLVDGNASLLLLNRTQEHAVWRAVLEADEDLASLRSVDSLAEMAAETWHVCCAALRRAGATADVRAAVSVDTRAFPALGADVGTDLQSGRFSDAGRGGEDAVWGGGGWALGVWRAWGRVGGIRCADSSANGSWWRLCARRRVEVEDLLAGGWQRESRALVATTDEAGGAKGCGCSGYGRFWKSSPTLA